MPIDLQKIRRRRLLLGMTHQDLAITAGISQASIQKLENGSVANGGGNTGIDLVQRLATALRMDIREILIAPTGNRYQRAVQFAAHQQSPESNPKLHDRSKTIRAEGYRRLTGMPSALDTEIITREEADAVVPVAPERELPSFDWTPDPSTE